MSVLRNIVCGFVFATLLAGGFGPTAAAQAPAPPAAQRVVQLRIDGEIEPILAEYLTGAIDQANKDHADLILITINTPGGLDTAMREIIQSILASHVPVVTYVTPTGSRAASAGFFILLSGDVAAMSPGTDTGAASPLMIFGGTPVQIDETLRHKIVNEATAYLRSFVTKRGRNDKLAETAVTDATAFSEKEALDGKLVDLIAPNTEALLGQLNGRTIARFDGTSTTLNLSHPVIETWEMSTRQKFLIADRPARCVFYSADRRRAGLVCGIHPSGNVRSGSDRRDRTAAGAFRDAPAAGESDRAVADCAGDGAVCAGGKISDARRAGCGRSDRHGAGCVDADSFAADGNGREPGRGVRRHACRWR